MNFESFSSLFGIDDISAREIESLTSQTVSWRIDLSIQTTFAPLYWKNFVSSHFIANKRDFFDLFLLTLFGI